MKIVGFEAEGGLRLGVVEGDQVIDLQAADPKVPADLGDVLAANNGDLKPLGDIAKRAPASARRPLKGLKFGLPVARPGKILCLGLNYLEHVKEGSQRDNIPKFPTIFMRCLTSMVPHEQPIVRPEGVGATRLRGRDDAGRRQAREASDHGERDLLHRGLFLLERRLGARIPAQDHPVGHGQELRPHRRLRSLDGDGRRTPRCRQGAEDRVAASTAPSCSRTTPTT